MKAARLTAAKEISLAEVPDPGLPEPGEVLIEVLSVGICGSDLHMYETGRIGGLRVEKPLIQGHEFSGRILATGQGACGESGKVLAQGMRVAVDPHVACGECEQCREGNPNLCPHHYFHGVPPTDGALCQRMRLPARNCHPVPESMSNATAALLEPLGVSLHAADLGRIRVGDTVAVIGCGPIGILIARLALLSGASLVRAFDLLEWRVRFAAEWGIAAHRVHGNEAVEIIREETRGRGVDVAIEAAWSDHSVQQSVEMARPGGRVVIVGIPNDDRFTMCHSEARRKGLTIRMARRMKHTYPRATSLAVGNPPALPLDEMVTHVYPLDQAPQAFADTAGYRNGLLKALVEITPD
ncbi:MAG: zinc-dependent alcohol dehydrogenase [Oceanipulchritudo sp.]